MKRVYLLPELPPRPESGHKGLFGRVLVVGGSEEMIGAPVLAATAALRMGSGLVQVALPKSVLAAGLAITPELVGLAMDDKSDKHLHAAVGLADVLIIGPGMGQSSPSRKRLLALLRIDKPMVVDADAINILAAEKTWPRTVSMRMVLTPHPGEMQRLLKHAGRRQVPEDDRGRIDLAVAAAKKLGCIVLLKGHRTVVTNGTGVYVNRTGDSSLSKAGSGDVLAGMIGSLMGLGMSQFDAACAGAWLHGKAGEIAGKRIGRRSVLARDVIADIACALAEFPL